MDLFEPIIVNLVVMIIDKVLSDSMIQQPPSISTTGITTQ
jgi:hypothetical protein